jgi:transcriptional regulator with XRE-family HTH domain
MAVFPQTPRVGELLRGWRQRRKISQFDLSLDSAVSSRHLSFIETGRSRPSREMVLHLAEKLDVPLRDRNILLVAAGYAPLYGERSLGDDDMSLARSALDRFLAAHMPFPGIALDRHLNIVAANDAIGMLLEGVAPWLLEPPANALRITLHEEGMAPYILNLPEWSAHLLERISRRIAITGDEALAELRREVAGYPGVHDQPPAHDVSAEVVLPLRVRRGADELSMICTQTTFGTAVDVTLAELSIEGFYPADDATAAVFRSTWERNSSATRA